MSDTFSKPEVLILKSDAPVHQIGAIFVVNASADEANHALHSVCVCVLTSPAAAELRSYLSHLGLVVEPIRT